ncbi:hypothetical protein Pla22_20630 [Rubripirellula amarantea]|uniref:Uncharacterized protein n=1 Tax=Rubripirellula amarantea TaxID=2527999 RepID=A0A5C5WUU1_9BACT|nr:DUF1573 domain-containing protein [Rubripirellula amarantea]TWT54416.1 hypothetical protein Pla22_20630 [Rubripirellula amarantea]
MVSANRVFWFELSVFACWLPAVLADEPLEKKLIAVDPESVGLSQRVTSYWVAKVNLGKVSAGDLLSCTFKLQNKSSLDVVVAGTDLQSGCKKLSIAQADWFSGDDLEVTAQIQVPERNQHTLFVTSASVVCASENKSWPKVSTQVQFVMEIANLLKFKPPVALHSASQSSPVEIEMPLLCTLENPDFIVKSTEPAIESAAKVAFIDDTWTVVIKLPPAKEGVEGDIVVIDQASKLSAEARVSVQRDVRATISPTFMQASEDADGNFLINGICRVRGAGADAEASADAGIAVEVPVAVQLTYQGKSVPTKVTNLGNGVARVSARLGQGLIVSTEGELTSERLQASWRILAGKESWNLTSWFVCQPRSPNANGEISVRDASSFFEGWGANVAAIKNYELVARYTKHASYPDGRDVDVERTVVFRADLSSKQSVRVNKYSEIEVTADGNELRKGHLSVDGINDRDYWSYSPNDHSVNRMVPKAYIDNLQSSGIENPLVVGLSKVAGSYLSASPRPEDRISSFLMHHPKSKLHLSEDHDLSVTRSYNAGEVAYTTKWMIDGKRLLPTRCVSLFEDRGVSGKLSDEFYTWTQTKGIDVVRSAYGDVLGTMQVGDTYKNFSGVYDWKFGWRKLNVPVEELNFAVENYDSQKEIEALIIDADAYLKTIDDDGE